MILMLATIPVNTASKCPKVAYLCSIMLQINIRGLDTTCDVKKVVTCIISLEVAY